MHTQRLTLLLMAAIMVAIMHAQRIAVLNDLHVSPDNANSLQLPIAIAEINATPLDMVVVNGDLTNEGADAELALVKSLLDSIRHPLYVVPGNHENNWSQSATKTFIDLWGNDRFVTQCGQLIAVGINCGPYMKMGDGHIKQEDLHWLRHTLDSLVTPKARVLSFNHYPIRKDDIDNYAEYQSLLERYPVALHVNGHYHAYDTYRAGDIDAVMTRALALKDTYGYSIIEVDGDSITISEKQLGLPPTTKYRLPVRTAHTASGTTTAQAVTSPEGYEMRCVVADSASVFTRLAFDDRHVLYGTSLGEAKAVDKASGATAWRVPLGASIFSRPTPLGGGRTAFAHPGGITIIGAEGDIISQLPSNEDPYVADGILVRDSLYIQGGYKRIECRHASDGTLAWCYDSIANYCQAAPVADGDDLIFGAWDTYLRCLDINDGTLRWQWSNGKSANLLSPGNVVPALTRDKVIIVAPDRYMTAIDRKTGSTIWRDNSHRYRESMGMSADSTIVYAKTMDGELVAVDATAETFSELWLCDMGLGYEHAPCVVAEVDGVVYAGSRRGLLTAVDAATHTLLWQLELGTSEINGIDIDPTDGTVWVSLIEGRLYRIAPL